MKQTTLETIRTLSESDHKTLSQKALKTSVRCVVRSNDKDVIAPIYIESKVTAYPYPVLVDYEKGRVLPINSKPPTVTNESK